MFCFEISRNSGCLNFMRFQPARATCFYSRLARRLSEMTKRGGSFHSVTSKTIAFSRRGASRSETGVVNTQ
jgi:hypothetical protein